MVLKQIKWVYYALLVWSIVGCSNQKSTKTIDLSTLSSTDTISAGTPKGMHLYFKDYGALNLTDILAEQGYGTDDMHNIRVKEIRIKVEIPENNFNPSAIESFNTSFTKQGSLNTVIESNNLDYRQRTYIIPVHEDISSVSKLDNVIDLSGGLRLKEKLRHDVVLTTSVMLEAVIDNE